MKALKAKIELTESEIKGILADYLGVEPASIAFNVVQGQRDNNIVTSVIYMDIPIPCAKASQIVKEESKYEHYCPNNL